MIQRSSVVTSDLSQWAVTAAAARGRKSGLDDLVDLRLKAACAGPARRLDEETCALIDAQAKAGVAVRRIERVGEKWVMNAIKNPDAPLNSGLDMGELMEAAIQMGAAYYTGGASGALLGK